MVKKITVYTAFGQFLQMVEQQAEKVKEQIKCPSTDNYSVDHPLSDYQSALNSVREVHAMSCPAHCSVSNNTLMVKKCLSCPLASFAVSQPVHAKVEASPVPTTFETRALNDATCLMMSFWKDFVTKLEEEQQMASIFEKLEGLFSVRSATSTPSLFGKYEELFENMPEERKREEKEEQPVFVWVSPNNASIPQLPVFVKSPVDSLKIYKGAEQRTDEMADDEMSAEFESSSCSFSSSSASSCSSTTVIHKPDHLVHEIHLQRAVIAAQKRIIDSLYSLQYLNKGLADLYKNHKA